MLSVTTLHGRKLCISSRTSEHSFVSVYKVYSLNTDNISCIVYYIKKTVYDYLRVFSSEMALNVGLDLSFDNMYDWKGMLGK